MFYNLSRVLNITHFTVGPFLEHTYVVSDPDTKEALIIDPGGWNGKVLSYLKKENLKVKEIVSTHGHIDHIAGAWDLRQKTEATYRIHAQDESWLERLGSISAYFGFPDVKKPVIDSYLKEGDILRVGPYEIRVIETPGHTQGGVCFVTEGNIFVGDTLFQGSIGRTDLPGGDYDQLVQSINKRLMTLDEKLIVHCGHGEKTTIGQEKKTNPFLKGGNAAFF